MRGIYFLANDRVYDLVVAFLNSVRAFEPNIPICLIPYNQESHNIQRLVPSYSFSVWSDHAALERCDAISKHFHSTASGQYRKLVIWDGPYEEFAYIDIDTVLLSGLDVVFRLLNLYDVITGISNLATIRKFAWKSDTNKVMPTLDTDYSANTGFIVSRSGVITLAQAEQRAKEAVRLRDFMALDCAEQPFLNYLVVTSGIRYTSLSQLRRVEMRSDLPKELWAGMFDEDILQLSMLPLIVHWAGKWQTGEHLRSLTWRHFRYLRADR
jgi:hypothetical protein